MPSKVLLIDLSSLAHPLYHTLDGDPNPNAVSIATVDRVRALASGMPSGVAVCYDTGKSFRNDVDPTYKANRPKDENRAVLHHQIDLAIETLRGDGFQCWGVKGFEADDVIATATHLALNDAGAGNGPEVHTITVATSDKDLLQLVRQDGRCVVKGLKEGNIIDAAGVVEKLKVLPEQVNDYLALVGDTSDNVIGAKGIGPKRAADLLLVHGTLDNLYEKMKTQSALELGLTLSIAQSLLEFQPRLPVVRELLTLRTDVPIPFEEIWRARVPVNQDIAVFGDEPMTYSSSDMNGQAGMLDDIDEAVPTLLPGVANPGLPMGAGQVSNPSVPNGGDSGQSQRIQQAAETGRLKAMQDAGMATPAPQAAQAIAQQKVAQAPPLPLRQPTYAETAATIPQPVPRPSLSAQVGDYWPQSLQIVPAPLDFERALEPRDLNQALTLAKAMFQSRLFSAYGTPEGIFSTILAGRELGMQAMSSLRAFHLVEGRPTLSADLIRALVLKSGKAKYFRPIQRSATSATWETQRGDDPPVSLTYTHDEAVAAGLVKKGSAWEKNPADMCVKTASSKLARLVYADVTMNLYSPEEL